MSNDTLIVSNPINETEEKESNNEESECEWSDRIVPPTVNHPVKLKLHNVWSSVFTVADNMIRTSILYKLKQIVLKSLKY